MSKPSYASDEHALRDPQQQALFEKVFGRIVEVSSLPAAATRAVEVASDPKSSADDLLDVVQSDPALSARILRSVNSAFYGIRQDVTDLKSAITMLGFKEVRNLALTVYVAELFKENDGFGPYRRDQLWQHLVGVGSASRLIARLCGKVVPEEAYLAGLLHDLGIILLDQQLHRLFCQVVVAVADGMPTCDAERHVLEFDHTELGAHAARCWGFPDAVVAVIRYHHMPDCCDGAHRRMVHTVALANHLCSRTGLTSMGVHSVAVPPDTCFVELGISKDQLASIWQQLEPTLQSAAVLAAL